MNDRNQRLAILAGVIILILAIGVIIVGNGNRSGLTETGTPTVAPATTQIPTTQAPTITIIPAKATEIPTEQVAVVPTEISPTVTSTHTPSSVPTNTTIPTNTPSNTIAPSSTSTNTARPTNTNTVVPSNTPTNTVIPPTNTATSTVTSSSTPTNTVIPTNTATRTMTPSNTPTNTATSTITPSNTATSTATNTPIPTDTPSSTSTRTNTSTLTSTATSTVTASNTPTNTTIPTDTPSNTPTHTATAIIPPSKTPTETIVPSNTPTPTVTVTSTPQATLSYDAQCLNYAVTFTITNSGSAQSQPMTYSVQDKSGTILKTGSMQLGATSPDNTTIITYEPATGEITLLVMETGTTLIPVKTVDCGEPTATPTSSTVPTETPAPTGTPMRIALAPQGQCQAGLATFTINNNSGGDMPAADTYTINDSNGGLVQQGSFQLRKGESTMITVSVPNGASTLTLTTAGTGLTIIADCNGTTPTAAPNDANRCGETTYDSNGFPIIATNLAGCQPEQTQPVEWTPITPAASACPDWLLYHTFQTGDWEIFRLGDISGGAGADPNISKGVGKDISDISPARSPDSAWIAFTSNRDGNWELYVVGADGKNLQRVTKNTTAIDIDPVWSPDGSKIVYESSRTGNWELYEFNVTNGSERALTNNPAQDVNAVYSPDGTKLIFQSNRDGQWQIYELDVNMLQEKRLSDGQGNDNDPQYSPDGTHIAFWSQRGEATNGVLYVMDADGQNAHAISDTSGDVRNQAYSADGDLIAYQMQVNGKSSIYVYQFSTQKTRQVTNGATNDFAPTWFCKSPTVVWTSNADGSNSIYMTNALPIDAAPIDVKTQGTPLTNDPANEQYPENFPAEENASLNHK